MDELKPEKVAADRGVVVRNPLPYCKENIRLSKEKFVAKEKKRREDELKVSAFRESLKEKKEEPKPEIKSETEKKDKPRGRPRKIK